MSNYDDPKRRRPIDYVEEPLGYNDAPFIDRPKSIDRRGSLGMWVAAAAALGVVLALFAYAIITKQTNVTETKPTVTETRSTTGSGTTSPAQQK